MNIAIVDDEVHAGETLKYLLDKMEFEYESCRIFHDSAAAVEELKINNPDLIFLDIEMPELNGFQFLEKLNLPDIKVIFTTAYSKFAVKAFRVNAIDYLIKPIEIDELKESLKKIEIRQADFAKIKDVFKEIEIEKNQRSKIALPSAKGIDFLEFDQIVFCQSDRNYTEIVLQNGNKKMVSKTLKEIEEQLPASIFFRVHNSYIANLQKVTGYIHSDGGMLILNNNYEIKISRNRKKELLDRLNDL